MRHRIQTPRHDSKFATMDTLCMDVILMKQGKVLDDTARARYRLDSAPQYIEEWEDYLLEHVTEGDFIFDNNVQDKLHQAFDDHFEAIDKSYTENDDDMYKMKERQITLLNSIELVMYERGERIPAWHEFIKVLAHAMELSTDARNNLMHIVSLEEVACMGRDIGHCLACIFATHDRQRGVEGHAGSSLLVLRNALFSN